MMNAFAYGIFLQWKLDIRNKGVVLTYYVVPLVFFGFMGGIFTSINPVAKLTLIETMTIFGVTMGAFLGAPINLVELYGSDIKKAYNVGGIPLGIGIINNLISGFIHLYLVSLAIFFISPLLFNASVPDNLLLYFMVLAVFIFTCLLIGTVVGLFVKSMARLTMVSQFLFLPSIMLSGIMFPSNLLPGVFKYVGKIFPATWALVNMSNSNISELSMVPFILISIATVVLIVIKIRHLKED